MHEKGDTLVIHYAGDDWAFVNSLALHGFCQVSCVRLDTVYYFITIKGRHSVSEAKTQRANVINEEDITAIDKQGEILERDAAKHEMTNPPEIFDLIFLWVGRFPSINLLAKHWAFWERRGWRFLPKPVSLLRGEQEIHDQYVKLEDE